MGKVSNYLINAITKQVETSGLVVWYDPEVHYQDIAQDLILPGTTIARYTDSFFDLRHEIEPLLGILEPPRLVIYVPLSQGETHNALVECEAAGVVMKPGQQPPARNTRLSLIARNSLKSHMTDEAIVSIEKQVEAGKLSLTDLDKLAEGEGKVFYPSSLV